MVHFPTLQTTHRYFGARLKEYEDELTRLQELPAFLDQLAESRLLLSSGMCLAIDTISCSSTCLNPDEIKESNDHDMLIVNLQPLHREAKCQPLFCLSSKTGNGSDIQGTFDESVTEVKTHIAVPAISSDGDPSYNFRHDNFSSCGSRLIEKMGEISTSY
jgi:hypothetical protein